MPFYRPDFRNRMLPWERLVDRTVEMAQESAKWTVPLALRRMEILESLALMRGVDEGEIGKYFREKELDALSWARKEMDDPTFRKRALDFVGFKMPSVRREMPPGRSG